MTDFRKLHDAIRELDGTGSVFVPGDVESQYELMRQDEDGWPEWSEVEDDLLNNWYWNKGIADRLSEIGNEIIFDMIVDVMNRKETS